ncbi:hypothetical protein [Psychrobacter urativorans]|uniref:Lipoprotein n=1 Tax=Psychrobacter urativorans TaxID=45610 RepID=A0A0M5MK94_9GAMM|nr:hypothetical protein [Psychrobacter urativorans]ALF60975.1 hypothetical protein AOC03_12440 [Psychrobacter urativorans]
MKTVKLLPIVLALGVTLSACQTKKIDCSNKEGLSAVIAALTKDAEQEIKSTNPTVTLSAIRAAINNLAFSIKEVRTSKQDPNSTKVFCEAAFVVNVPVNVIEDAEEAMKKAGYDSNVELALEENGFEISSAAANSYQATISYNLQPTDDGKSTLSRIDEGKTQVVNAIHDLIVWSMAKNELAKQSDKITQDVIVIPEVKPEVKIETAPAEIEPVQTIDTAQTFNNEPVFEEFFQANTGENYFNCAYKGKTASKKCLVTITEVNASIDSRIRERYEPHYTFPKMVIKWPDGDVSRYVSLSDNSNDEILNLANRNAYQVRDNNPIDLFIDSQGEEHVHLW